jgi:hypothetical protein
MSAIMPEGERLRNAVKWISGQKEEYPELPVNKLINEAIMRFDLNPKEADFLLNFYRKEKHEQ